MSITSKPLVSPPSGERAGEGKKTKQSAVVSRAQLERGRGRVERLTAYIVLLVSFVGTIVALHGGWEVVLTSGLQVRALVGGVLLQVVLTWLQWSYHHIRALCWGSRLVDAALTAYGYGPLFIVALVGYLTERSIPQPLFAGWFILGLVSLLLAWYPESRLVD
jgi:hypothetical protein